MIYTTHKEAVDYSKQYIRPFEQGQRKNKVVRFMYQHLDDQTGVTIRMAQVYPVACRYGRNGYHFLTWDVEKNHWRRFALSNVMGVFVTDATFEPTEEFEKAMEKVS